MLIKDFKCPFCGFDLSGYDIPVMSRSDIVTDMAVCPGCSKEIQIPKPATGQGITLGDFVLESRLGAGGMGEVWLANQISMDRKVAVKILSPALSQDNAYVSRFMQEVKLSAKLEHPNIVTAFYAGDEKGLRYMAVAFIDGEDVESKIEKEKHIPQKEALRIARDIASALDYAWDKHRILHRDIKPANIMVDRSGAVKLMDMGISKSTDAVSSMTMTGTMVGTPHYMSIEQAMGSKDLDFRSDEYSLGATLYHMVVGEVPFDAPTTMAVLMKHMNEPLPSPKDRNPAVSDQCCALLEIMMAKDPANRHKSWKDLIADIDLVMAGKYPAAKRPSPSATMVGTAIPRGANSSRPGKNEKSSSMPRRNPMEAGDRPLWKKPLAIACAAVVVLIAAVAIFAILKTGGTSRNGGIASEPQKNAPSVAFVPSTTAPVDDATAEQMIKAAIEELKKKNPQQKEWKVEYKKSGIGWELRLSGNTELSDISPLKGLPLVLLQLDATKVSDIAPLKGMPLEELYLNLCKGISDISPISGLKIRKLALSQTLVADISTLKGMPLTTLWLGLTKISDIRTLRGMPLDYLCLRGCNNLRDISSLSECKNLRNLLLSETQISDISVLKGKSIYELLLDNTLISDISALSGMPIGILDLSGTKIANIAPLKGMSLKSLSMGGCSEVKDLSILKGMPLEGLILKATGVSDLSPLAGMPLKQLYIAQTEIKDVSVLKSCSDLELVSGLSVDSDGIDSLRALKQLKSINYKTPAEFWKSYDAAKKSTNASPAVANPSNEKDLYLVVDISGAPDAKSYPVTYLDVVPPDLLTNQKYKTTSIVMRRVPAGDFMMGETGKQHKVILTKDFYLGVFEVTQGQWEMVMKVNPSRFKDVGKDAPVEQVSWEDCQKFVKELNNESKTLDFRLPTESEWEYACRGGDKTSKGFEYSGSGTPDEVAWFKDNGGNKTHPIGQKKANELGIYDMTGNVWEWCDDWHGEYSKEIDKDPQGAKSGSSRVNRGGGWHADAGFCRSVNRRYSGPSYRNPDLGFRLALSEPRQDRSPAEPSKPAQQQPATNEKKNMTPDELQKALKAVNPEYDMMGKIDFNNESQTITSLKLTGKSLSNIEPLAGLKLKGLDISWTSISDLKPIKNMPLEGLNLKMCTNVKDISALQGMPLKSLDIRSVNISDISALKGMPLKSLLLGSTKVSDLTPIAGMPLENLDLTHCTSVSDISPLSGMPLKYISLVNTKVNDLEILKSCVELERVLGLSLDMKGIEILRSLKNLKTINDKPAEEFWKSYDESKKNVSPAVTPSTPSPATSGKDWNADLKLADAAFESLKYDEAVGLYEKVVPAMESDKKTDKTILSDFLGKAQKHLSEARFLSGRDKLPAETQLKILIKKLSEVNGAEIVASDLIEEFINPGSSTKKPSQMNGAEIVCESSKIEGGNIVALSFNKQQVLKEIWPLKGMKLRDLTIKSCPVEDLSVLKGMPLNSLDISATPIADMKPLENMSLKILIINATKVSNLSFVRTLADLKTLYCADTQVSDLSPLKGLKLEALALNRLRITDIQPLKGMPLKELNLKQTRVADITAIKGMPLERLILHDLTISDLSPVQGMPLIYLELNGTQVEDLSPLKDMPLQIILLCGKEKDLSTLASCKGLEKIAGLSPETKGIDSLRVLKKLKDINGKPAVEFWKNYDAGKK